MTEKTAGNIILMTLICLVIFWVFMALRPANAWQYSEEYQAGPASIAALLLTPEQWRNMQDNTP